MSEKNTVRSGRGRKAVSGVVREVKRTSPGLGRQRSRERGSLGLTEVIRGIARGTKK